MTDRNPPPAAPPFGALGHYELVSHIGQGGMGDVYLAFEPALDRQVALKVLPEELGRRDDFARRFRAEAAAAAKLVHPNIIPIYYIGEDQGRLFFTMQYVEGESLETLMSREGRLSPGQSLDILEPVLSGLGAAHKEGLVHRDVKPANILLERASGHVLLADFGLVKAFGGLTGGHTATGVVMGTADYIAPEQARGKPVDARADLYALGVVMYRMLEGRLPFAAENPLALSFKHVYELPPPLTTAPPALAAIVERLLAKSPDERYQNAESVLADLQKVRKAVADQPGKVGVSREWGGDPRSRPTVIVRAPALDFPAPPERVVEVRAFNRWEQAKDRALSLFRRHAPEVLQKLQNTQLQADGAVAEYARRQRDLSRLEDEAQLVLDELRAQREHLADAAPDGLRQQVIEQEQELGVIQARRAQVEAALATVRNQRDLLLARLKVAQMGSAEGAVSRRRRQRLALFFCGAAAALAVLVATIVRGRTEQTAKNSVVAGVESSEKPVATSRAQRAEPPLATRILEQPQFLSAAIPTVVVALAIREGNRLITAVCDDGTAGVWDTSAGQTVPLQTAAAAQPESVACSSDGRFVAAVVPVSATGGYQLQVWDSSQGGQPTEIAALSSPACILAVSDGQAIVTLQPGAPASQIVRWDVASRTELSRKMLESPKPGLPALSADGSIFASVENSGEIVARGLRDDDTLAPLDRSTCGAAPTALAFHPVQAVLAIGTDDGRVVCRDVRGGRQVFEIQEQGGSIRALAFDMRGRSLAVASGDRVRIWDLGLDYVRLLLNVPEASALAFNADGTQLATAGADRVVRLWSASFDHVADFYPWLSGLHSTGESGSAVLSRLPEPTEFDRARAVTRDGRLAIVRRITGSPYVEDARTARHLYDLPAPQAESVAVTPDGRYAATSHGSNRRGNGPGINLWDVASASVVRQFGPTDTFAGTVAFTPDGALLLYQEGGVIRSWNVESGAKVHEFRCGSDKFSFSADSRQMVVYSQAVGRDLAKARKYRQSVQLLYDLELGEPILEFTGCWPELIYAPRDILCDSWVGTLKRTRRAEQLNEAANGGSSEPQKN